MNKYLKYLEMLKFKAFNTIQLNTFKAYCSNNNLLLNSKTGSGKTYAYLIPILADLFDGIIKSVVVITPTNELITQVIKMANIIKGETKLVNGSSIYSDNIILDEFKNNTNKILFITPKKLLKLISLGLKKDNFDCVIFDEADMMYEGDFLNDTLSLLDIYSTKRKIIVSATIKINSLPNLKSIIGPTTEISDNNPYSGQNHFLMNSDYTNKDELLKDLIKTINPFLAIIFASKKELLLEIKNILDNENKKSILLSSDNTLKERKKILNNFKIDNTQYIVASDLYARGIDLEVSDVINYDIPNNLDYFVHRSGRCARAGRNGNIYTIYSKKDNYKINRLKAKGLKFNNIRIKNNEIKIDVKQKKDNKILSEVKKTIKLGKVKPNYKKKYKAKLTKAIKSAKVKEILKKKRANKFKEDK